MKRNPMIYLTLGSILGAGGVLLAVLWTDLPLREFFSPGDRPEAPRDAVGSPPDNYELPLAPPVSDIVGPRIGLSNVRPDPYWPSHAGPGPNSEEASAAAERRAVHDRFDRLDAALGHLAPEPPSPDIGTHPAEPLNTDERRRMLLNALRILETDARGSERECE